MESGGGVSRNQRVSPARGDDWTERRIGRVWRHIRRVVTHTSRARGLTAVRRARLLLRRRLRDYLRESPAGDATRRRPHSIL